MISFIYVKNVIFTSFNRVLAGILQVNLLKFILNLFLIYKSFIAIYFPIWVDQYGSKSTRTIMMAFQAFSSPFGVVVGYIVTYIIKMYTDVNNLF